MKKSSTQFIVRAIFLSCSILIFSTVFSTENAAAQQGSGQQGSAQKAPQGSSSAQQGSGSAQQGSSTTAPAAQKPAKPWKPSVSVHIEKGTNKGYLVLQLDLSKGHHIYSLSPQGSPAPTKIEAANSQDLRVLGPFAANTQPEVIANDPIFKQRIEKHKGVVKFFAPVEVRPGIDLSKLAAQVTFSGQVCSDQSCRQIQSENVSGKFAGFFDSSPKTGAKPAAQNNGSSARR